MQRASLHLLKPKRYMTAATKRLSDPADYPVREWWADMSKLGPHLDTINQDHHAPRRGWGKELPLAVAFGCAAKLRGLVDSDMSMESRQVTVHDDADSFDGAIAGWKRLSGPEGIDQYDVLLFVHSSPGSASRYGCPDLDYDLTEISMCFNQDGDRVPPRQFRKTMQNLHSERQKLHSGEFWNKTRMAGFDGRRSGIWPIT